MISRQSQSGKNTKKTQIDQSVPNVLKQPIFWQKIFKQYKFSTPTRAEIVKRHLFLATVCLVFGIVCTYLSHQVKEVVISHYDEWCGYKQSCVIPFQPKETMTPPIYVYYQLENLEQNERRYVQSKSALQLGGQQITHQQASLQCDPIVTNEDLRPYVQNLTSWGGIPLDPNAIASPCGLVARSFFNDSYIFFADAKQQNRLQVIETGIAWPGEVNRKFARQADSESTQWIDPTNEHFIVWMRAAAFRNFRKLWGRMDYQALNPNQHYYVQVINNYDAKVFQGHKNIILSTESAIGGKNIFLSTTFFVSSALFLVLSYIFWRKKQPDQANSQQIQLQLSQRQGANQHSDSGAHAEVALIQQRIQSQSQILSEKKADIALVDKSNIVQYYQ